MRLGKHVTDKSIANAAKTMMCDFFRVVNLRIYLLVTINLVIRLFVNRSWR
jgi:hypothetical protein